MSVECSPEKYASYMDFPNPQEDLWTTSSFETVFQGLGIVEPQVTKRFVNRIKSSYNLEPPSRYYHTLDHASFVGTPHIPDVLAAQLRVFSRHYACCAVSYSGKDHDRVSPKIDIIEGTMDRMFSEEVKEDIGKLVDCAVSLDDTGKQIFRISLTEQGKNDPVTQMVSSLFHVGAEGITHLEGASEFASALVSVKLLEQQGKPHDQLTYAEKKAKAITMITDATLIAGTIPFGTSVERDNSGKIVRDGTMGDLFDRLRTVHLTIDGETFSPDWQTCNDIMLLCVHLANRDISSLIISNNVATVIAESRQLKKEEIRSLRQGVTTMDGLVEALGRDAGSPLLYRWISGEEEDSPVTAEKVPKVCFLRDEQGEIIPGSLYPPEDVYEQAVFHAGDNCSLGDLFYQSHELGGCLAASLATLVDEQNPPVPGFVQSKIWHPRANPQGEIFDYLSPGEALIYNELRYGTHQQDVDSATSRRSPVGAMIFGSLGGDGIRVLSNYVKEVRHGEAISSNPFADINIATEYVQKVREKIGEENFRTIVGELHRVAIHYQDDPVCGNPDRAEKLQALI